MSKNHLKNKVGLLFRLLFIALLLLAASIAYITGGGNGISARQTAATQTAQAGAPTATYGSEQFHLQQTAWAEP
jgi:hypothetical protein